MESVSRWPARNLEPEFAQVDLPADPTAAAGWRGAGSIEQHRNDIAMTVGEMENILTSPCRILKKTARGRPKAPQMGASVQQHTALSERGPCGQSIGCTFATVLCTGLHHQPHTSPVGAKTAPGRGQRTSKFVVASYGHFLGYFLRRRRIAKLLADIEIE
jgi:hypothetical protein